MRLSSRLSDKSKNSGEIESFIDWEKYTTVKEEEAFFEKYFGLLSSEDHINQEESSGNM